MKKASFWRGKKVFITGHNGCKGTWLTILLHSLGAEVIGYSLAAPSGMHFFEQVNGATACQSYEGDIRDYASLLEVISHHQPDVVFHLAAQPSAQVSYTKPVETYHTNVLGTVHLLEAIKQVSSVRVIVSVASGFCYENDGTGRHFFKETDALGGYDAYSASKACAELVTNSYRKCYFATNDSHGPRLASVRPVNIIGGGDWAESKLLPSIVYAYMNSTQLTIKFPQAIRPWQYVLDALHGYLILAQNMWESDAYAEAWNFGPSSEAYRTVQEFVEIIMARWNKKVEIVFPTTEIPYELPALVIDSKKANERLKWLPKLGFRDSIDWTMKWYDQYIKGEDIASFTRQQIELFKTLS